MENKIETEEFEVSGAEFIEFMKSSSADGILDLRDEFMSNVKVLIENMLSLYKENVMAYAALGIQIDVQVHCLGDKVIESRIGNANTLLNVINLNKM